MKEVIEVIAKALVDDPASVKVEETIDGDTTVTYVVALLLSKGLLSNFESE